MFRTNRIADNFRNHHGHVVRRPANGSSFDEANDCHIIDGHIVFRHHCFTKRDGINLADYGGKLTVGAMCDAIILWERHMNPGADFADDPTECGFGGE